MTADADTDGHAAPGAPDGAAALIRALAAADPAIADLYESHVENNDGRLLPHVFFDDLAQEVVNAHLGVVDPAAPDLTVDVTAFSDAMERLYDPTDPRARAVVITSFVLALPAPGRPGHDVVDRLGPRLRAEFDRARPAG
jgi:hypothetical protein